MRVSVKRANRDGGGGGGGGDERLNRGSEEEVYKSLVFHSRDIFTNKFWVVSTGFKVERSSTVSVR